MALTPKRLFFLSLSLSSCLPLFSAFFSRAHYWVNKYILKNACELQRVVLYFKESIDNIRDAFWEVPLAAPPVWNISSTRDFSDAAWRSHQWTERSGNDRGRHDCLGRRWWWQRSWAGSRSEPDEADGEMFGNGNQTVPREVSTQATSGELCRPHFVCPGIGERPT